MVPNLVEDYDYDDNGNLTKDDNKGITAITYNHLNLPLKISFGSLGAIEYLYNAIGVKVCKTIFKTSTGSIPTMTHYLNGFQYVFRENYLGYETKLKFFSTAEGYVEPDGSSYKYVYQYKDHLGNVRYSYDRISYGIQEENNYYPFGMKHEGYNNYSYIPVVSNYKYNGKELQDEFGLNVYDYGARLYDPARAGWSNIDPLAEKYPGFSPYAYCLDNPIKFVDQDGREPTPYQAAIMAKHVYGDSKIKLVGGWKVSSAGKGLALNNETTGFKSQVYERTVKGKTEYTYATAGTEDMVDVKQDVKQVFGLAEQYKQSVEVAGDLKTALPKGAELTFTGHSLGGGLAEANAIATGDNAITFNAAGLSVFSPGGNQQSNTTNAYILTTDPLNAAQSATGLPTAGGTKHFIGPGSIQGAKNGHSIDSMIEGLQTKSTGQFIKNSIDNIFKSE